ncbi:MAG: LysM peptidoglycan-binding domain-containing protein [Acidimicrobiia bacterium]|nr:LysM peptidoglycan-binding domain-containing protein [Acidimicrobiia bacterium]
MNGHRAVRMLRGVVSLLATLALLLGVPLLLTTWVGWPLPTSMPSLDALEQAARSGISDEVVVKTLAVIAWIAWAQLALALLVETIAVARGRQAIHLPVLPGFQVTAARLVGGILMIASTVQPARAYAAPLPIPAVAEATVEASAATTTVHSFLYGVGNGDVSPPSLHTDPGMAVAPADHPTVTVQRHDSYWAIAERTLGDGLRWREILDLNVGRTLPDGTTITAGDDTLHAGWVLLLPADATGDAVAAEPTSASDLPPQATETRDYSSVIVERGDNLWTISEDRLEVDLGREPADSEVVPYWREVIDANQGRYVQPGNPNLILPGQVLVLPPTGHEPPATPPVEAEPAPPPEPAQPRPEPEERGEPAEAPITSTTTVTPSESEATPPPTEETAPASADDAEGGAGLDVAGPVAVAVGGLSSIALAVGLKRLLDRRRRRFANEHDGQLPGRTPLEQRDLHHAVVAQADEERIDDLQGVLGWLAASLAATSSARRPRMIRHSAESVEILLDQPDPNPPAGWAGTDDGAVWTLEEPPDPDDPYDGPLSPAPLIVTIGQPEDDAQLYLDLEADSLLALTGDPDVATNLARSIVAELALSPLAETLRVIAVGDVVDPDAKVLEHLTVVDCWEGIAEDLLAWASQSHEALAENDWPNAFVGRGHEPDHDALVPLAVVADRPPPIEVVDSLRTSLPSAVAVVVVGAFDGAVATVRCEVDALNFEMVDLACTPQEVAADELAAMCRLLVATDSPEEQQLMDELRAEHAAAASTNGSEPVADSGHAGDRETAAPVLSEPPTYDVLVRLLGDITVEGGKPLKPKASAVVSYLALHRTVTTERLEEACWFGSDGSSHRKRLRDVMTEIRDALGSQHFPANRSGAYVAGPQVRTDLDLFEWHVQRAADVEPGEAISQYRAALDLVTGKPFSYPNAARASYGWVDFEHHSTTWEYRVASVAQACAELCLDAGEPGESITMLRRVVQAIPLNGPVVEALMRAHLASDDRAGADRVYQEHANALQQAKLGDPEDTIEQLRLDLQSRR